MDLTSKKVLVVAQFHENAIVKYVLQFCFVLTNQNFSVTSRSLSQFHHVSRASKRPSGSYDVYTQKNTFSSFRLRSKSSSSYDYMLRSYHLDGTKRSLVDYRSW